MSNLPVEKATPIRYPSVALMCVNSADAEQYSSTTGGRLDDNTPARIYINQGRPFLFGYMTRIALTEVNINWATPNVNPLNNTLTIKVFNETTSTTTIRRLDVLPGFYSPSELSTFIQLGFITQFSADINYTVAPGVVDFPMIVLWDNTNSCFQLSAEDPDPTTPKWDPFKIQIMSSAIYRPTSATVPVALPALDYDLTDMMGLNPIDTGNTTYSIIRGGYASMMYTPYIDIVSNILTKNQNVQDGDSYKLSSSAKLARIYFSNEQIEARYEKIVPTYDNAGVVNGSEYETNIIGCRPFNFKREFSFPKQIQWNTTENVDVMDLSVLDYKGNPVYIIPKNPSAPDDTLIIGNTADFQFTIQATEQ